MSGRIQNGAKLFASVNGRKLHGAKIIKMKKGVGYDELELDAKLLLW